MKRNTPLVTKLEALSGLRGLTVVDAPLNSLTPLNAIKAPITPIATAIIKVGSVIDKTLCDPGNSHITVIEDNMTNGGGILFSSNDMFYLAPSVLVIRNAHLFCRGKQ